MEAFVGGPSAKYVCSNRQNITGLPKPCMYFDKSVYMIYMIYIDMFDQTLPPSQGFPVVLMTWEGNLQNLMGGGGVSQKMGEHGRFKIVSKNSCEGVHLIVKLPAISL